MPTHSRNQRVPIAAVAAAILLSGCTAPQEVQQFTAAAKDAVKSLPALVRDIPASCVRRQLAQRPVAEIADIDDQATQACRSLSDLEPRLTGALDVLANYLNALGELASDQVVTYDRQIDAFASSLQSTGAFQEPEVKATTGLAKFLANAVSSGYQRKKIIETLDRADADLATLCDGMSRVIGADYVRVLQNEELALRSRYRDAIQGDPAKSPATALIIQEYWRRDLSVLNQKKAAAQSGVEMLRRIRDGHKALAAQANHWTAKDLVQKIAPYTGSIQTLLADYRKVF
jgi:hypothetical protein